MAQAPIMPVMTDALIGDTTHLSTEQFGAYLLILIATWRNNGVALPDDDQRMALICRVTVKRWRARLRPILIEFFDVSTGHWRQKRLELEWERVAKMINSRRTSGNHGGRPKSRKTKETTKAYGFVLQNLDETNPDPKGELRSPNQDSPISESPESLDAARAREMEREDNEKGNPEGARCARLDRVAVRAPPRPAPVRKSPALRAKIREQLACKHARFVQARDPPEKVASYWAVILGDDPAAARRLFEDTDYRMRASRWDDMREWKRAQGIGA